MTGAQCDFYLYMCKYAKRSNLKYAKIGLKEGRTSSRVNGVASLVMELTTSKSLGLDCCALCGMVCIVRGGDGD